VYDLVSSLGEMQGLLTQDKPQSCGQEPLTHLMIRLLESCRLCYSQALCVSLPGHDVIAVPGSCTFDLLIRHRLAPDRFMLDNFGPELLRDTVWVRLLNYESTAYRG